MLPYCFSRFLDFSDRRPAEGDRRRKSIPPPERLVVLRRSCEKTETEDEEDRRSRFHERSDGKSVSYRIGLERDGEKDEIP